MAVIQIVGLVGGGDTPFDGQYVKEYDPSRPGVDPRGLPMLAHIVCTPSVAEAKRFATGAEALEFWRKSDGTFRPDGKPNRPLTAFTVLIV